MNPETKTSPAPEPAHIEFVSASGLARWLNRSQGCVLAKLKSLGVQPHATLTQRGRPDTMLFDKTRLLELEKLLFPAQAAQHEAEFQEWIAAQPKTQPATA